MQYFKTTGNLFHAGVSYEKGHIFTEDEVNELGIDRTSLAPADEGEKVEQDAAAAPTQDADAELDSAEGPLPSAPTNDDAEPAPGGDANGSAPTDGEGADKTLPHILTEADLEANPKLVADGLKVGDEVAIPAVEHILTEEDREAHPEYFERPEGMPEAKVGDTILIPEEEKEEEPEA